MQNVISVIFPVFAIIGLGYLMVKRDLFSQSGVIVFPIMISNDIFLNKLDLMSIRNLF